MKQFIEWYTVREAANAVSFLDGDVENVNDGQVRKFILSPDGKIVIAPPDVDHAIISKSLPPETEFNRCVYGVIMRAGVVMRDNGVMPDQRLIDVGLKSLVHAGMITPRMTIIYPTSKGEKEVRGTDLLSLRQDPAQAPVPHISNLRRVASKDNDKMINSDPKLRFTMRNSQPKNWFYRYGESRS